MTNRYRLHPDVKISDYKVMGGETLLTETFKLELDGEIGFAPKSLFVLDTKEPTPKGLPVTVCHKACFPDVFSKEEIEAERLSVSKEDTQ